MEIPVAGRPLKRGRVAAAVAARTQRVQAMRYAALRVHHDRHLAIVDERAR
jgi:hypothetical protein